MNTGAKGAAHVAKAALDFTTAYVKTIAKVGNDTRDEGFDALVTRSYIVEAAYQAAAAADCATRAAETYARLVYEHAVLSDTTQTVFAIGLAARAAESTRSYAEIAKKVATKVTEDVIEEAFESDQTNDSLAKLATRHESTTRSVERLAKTAIIGFDRATQGIDGTIHADAITKTAYRAAGDLETISKAAVRFLQDLLKVGSKTSRAWD